jgi:hypothetical protein
MLLAVISNPAFSAISVAPIGAGWESSTPVMVMNYSQAMHRDVGPLQPFSGWALRNESLCRPWEATDDQKTASALIACLQEEGYLYARTEDVQVNRKALIYLFPGPRMKLRSISHQNKVQSLSDKLLMNLTGLQTGQYLGPQMTVNLAKKLDQRRLLQNPRLRIEPYDTEQIDLIVDGEYPNSVFSFGAELQSSGTPVLNVRGRHYLVNPTPGFVDYALNLNKQQGLQHAEIGIPAHQGQNYEWKTEGAVDNSDMQVFTMKKLRIGLRGDNSMGSSNANQWALNAGTGLNKIIEKTNVENNHFTQWNIWLEVKANSPKHLPSVQLKALIDVSVNVSKPQSFALTQLRATGQSVILDFNNTLFHWDAQYSKLLGNFNTIPLANRLYLGGTNSIKGYQENSIGSLLKRGNETGLRSAFSYSFEILKSIKISNNEFPIGIHFDQAFVTQDMEKIESYKSIGFIAHIKNKLDLKIHVSQAIDEPGKPVRAGVQISTPF